MRDLVTLMLITIALAWCADHVAFGPVKHNRRQRLIVCTVVICVSKHHREQPQVLSRKPVREHENDRV